MNQKPHKPKKCKAKGCGVVFTSTQPFRTWCSPDCGLSIASAKKEKAEQRKRSDERKKDRETLDRLKTRSDWMKEAQREFNKYIRVRDGGGSCISCGSALLAGGIGGGFDCGHYRSVGSAPHLRFDERNAHGQCKRCNLWGSGRAVDYRIGLIGRIGIEQVCSIEADQTPRKFTITDLKQIRDTYRAKARELEKQKEEETC